MRDIKIELKEILEELDKLDSSKVEERKALLTKSVSFSFSVVTGKTYTETAPALILAILAQDTTAITKILTAFGADAATYIKQTDSDNWCALHFALKNGNVEGLQTLLTALGKEAATALNIQTKEGSTPFKLAIKLIAKDKVNCLIKNGALEVDSSQAIHYLTFACQYYDADSELSDIIEYLLIEIISNPRLTLPETLPENMTRARDRFNLEKCLLFSNEQVSSENFQLILSKANKLQKAGYIKNIEWPRQLLLQTIKYQMENETGFDYNTDLSAFFSNLSETSKLTQAVIYQFAKQKNLQQAGEILKECQLPEASLLLGYQYDTGKGQVKTYALARKHYYQAFVKAQEERKKSHNTNNKILDNIEDLAIEKLIQLQWKQPPELREKERTSLDIIKCYVAKQNYQQALIHITTLNRTLLEPSEQLEFNQLAATAYYSLASTQQELTQKTNLLKQATLYGHGQAALTLADNAVNESLSDFLKAADYCITALSATHATAIPITLDYLTKYFEKILTTDYDENISALVFKTVWTIFKNAEQGENNWKEYSAFLNKLLENKNLNEQDKMDIECILFMCYKNGRTVSLKALNIEEKKPGILSLKKSPDEIEKEKKSVIATKLQNLAKKHHFLSTYFVTVCYEENYGLKIDDSEEMKYYGMLLRYGNIAVANLTSSDSYKFYEFKKIQDFTKEKTKQIFDKTSHIRVGGIKNSITFFNELFLILINENLSENVKNLQNLQKQSPEYFKFLQDNQGYFFNHWQQRTQQLMSAQTEQISSTNSSAMQTPAPTPSAPLFNETNTQTQIYPDLFSLPTTSTSLLPESEQPIQYHGLYSANPEQFPNATNLIYNSPISIDLTKPIAQPVVANPIETKQLETGTRTNEMLTLQSNQKEIEEKGKQENIATNKSTVSSEQPVMENISTTENNSEPSSDRKFEAENITLAKKSSDEKMPESPKRTAVILEEIPQETRANERLTSRINIEKEGKQENIATNKSTASSEQPALENISTEENNFESSKDRKSERETIALTEKSLVEKMPRPSENTKMLVENSSEQAEIQESQSTKIAISIPEKTITERRTKNDSDFAEKQENVFIEAKIETPSPLLSLENDEYDDLQKQEEEATAIMLRAQEMMKKAQELKRLKAQQKQQSLEKQNQQLKIENQQLKTGLNKSDEKTTKLETENKNLQNQVEELKKKLKAAEKLAKFNLENPSKLRSKFFPTKKETAKAENSGKNETKETTKTEKSGKNEPTAITKKLIRSDSAPDIVTSRASKKY